MARLPYLLLLTALLAACGEDSVAPTAPAPGAASRSLAGGAAPGAVYTETNATSGNAVLVYQRAADGTLTAAGSVASGGTGTGAGLGSQGAVTLSNNGNWLLVVNAGSNDVSAFAVGQNGALTLRGRASSGGTTPISVTIHDDLVYVLNGGGAGNISGLRLGADGSLTPIAGSSRGLSGNAVGPAEVSFDNTGTRLVVTEKNTNKIVTWRVGTDGLASGRVINASAGVTPFGFTITTQGVLAVSEAFGGAPNASATSTYTINPDGTLHVISASTPTTETSACWAIATNNGKFIYVSNTGSGSVTGYAAPQGQLSLLQPDGVSAQVGAGPADIAVTRSSQYVYEVSGAAHTISGFAVSQATGALTSAGAATNVPVGVVGIAAY